MSTDARNLLEVARRYLQVGLCVLPAIPAEKRPAVPTWKEYQERLPTDDELEPLFRDAIGLCIITGTVSGNLELLDFDHGGDLFPAWVERVRRREPDLIDRLVVERTQHGGKHVVYHCAEPICGSIKLAQRVIETPDACPIVIGGKNYRPRQVANRWLVVLTLIETRGEGGLFLCAPTPGYQLEQGRFDDLPVLTAAQRDILLEEAWALNEWIEPASSPVPASPAESRPGDEFNTRGDLRGLLTNHGWQCVRSGENEYWRRPGKDCGWSATLKAGVFYVFSSNAAPFEPNRAYSPFSTYALLEHAGDFTSAARALQQQGFGSTPTQSSDVDLSAFTNTQILQPPSVWELIQQYPRLREPVIEGLLRLGETMNIIAPAKAGKSWLVIALALAIATGRKWLDRFPAVPGQVLIIDNELHPETSAHRIPKVADAMGIPVGEYGQKVFVQNMRGQLRDVFSLESFFASLEPGRFKVIILDAFYRFMPRDMDENDNGTMANIYNLLDRYAAMLGCCFVLIHHATKGNQSGKSVTDVGAGAGSQSRAADAHTILRQHEEPGAAVFEAAVRSWPPVPPFVLRWKYPLWTVAPDLDPTQLRPERPRRRSSEQPSAPWTVQTFVSGFVTADPLSKTTIKQRARDRGISGRECDRLLREAEDRGLIHRWYFASNAPTAYATLPQPGQENEP